MWGARPPRSAVNVVRRHVGSLRRLMEPRLPVRAVGRWLAHRHIGRERPAADPAAAQEIVAHCGRLPLALAVVAVRAAAHPGHGFPLAAVAAELRRSQGSLDARASP